MEQLLQTTIYGSELAGKINAMGAMAIGIANRWMLGWPERVRALVMASVYLKHLESQVDQEKEILVNETNLRHLSRREVLQIYEIREAPPAM